MPPSHPFVAQAFRPTKCVHCMLARTAHDEPEPPACTGCGHDQETYLGCEACAVVPERKAA